MKPEAVKTWKIYLIIRKPGRQTSGVTQQICMNVDFAPGHEYFHCCDSLWLTLDLGPLS